MSWESFVDETVEKLHNGEKLPSYFGCISQLLTGASPLPPKQQNNRYFQDFDSESYEKPAPVERKKTPKKQQPKVEEEEETNDFDFVPVKQKQQRNEQKTPFKDTGDNDSDSSAGSFTRKEEPKVKRPPPAFNSDDESSMIQPVQKKKKPLPPVKEEYYNSDEESQQEIKEKDAGKQSFQEEEEEEEQQQDQQQDIDYASKFREIGDAIYGRYWAPIEGTAIPRMNLESRLFTTFKVKKFNKIFTMLQEKSNGTPNSIHFTRVSTAIEEEED